MFLFARIWHPLAIPCVLSGTFYLIEYKVKTEKMPDALTINSSKTMLADIVKNRVAYTLNKNICF